MPNRARHSRYADASRENRPVLRHSVADEKVTDGDISQHRCIPIFLDLRVFATHTALWDDGSAVQSTDGDDTA